MAASCAHWFSSVTRNRPARSLTLSQKLFAEDTIAKYASFVGAGHMRKYDSPMEEGCLLSRADSPDLDSDEWRELSSQRRDLNGDVDAYA